MVCRPETEEALNMESFLMQEAAERMFAISQRQTTASITPRATIATSPLTRTEVIL
jgi:hypothetical protein